MYQMVCRTGFALEMGCILLCRERRHSIEQLLSYQDLGRAYREVKGFEWEGDYRPAAQEAIKPLLASEMNQWADCHLAEMAALDRPDRRYGTYTRALTTEVSDVGPKDDDVQTSVDSNEKFIPRVSAPLEQGNLPGVVENMRPVLVGDVEPADAVAGIHRKIVQIYLRRREK